MAKVLPIQLRRISAMCSLGRSFVNSFFHVCRGREFEMFGQEKDDRDTLLKVNLTVSISFFLFFFFFFFYM